MDDASRPVLIKKLYDRFFTSGITLAKLRNSTISGRLFPGPANSMNVAGRSLAWKVFLAKDQPLQASLPPRVTSLLESLSESRKRYALYLGERLRAPDGNPAVSASDNLKSSQQKLEVHETAEDLDWNNPLSLHDENPWNEWFAGVELRNVISQDVERTFPDIDFYRQTDVQEQLTNILFLYSVMHPSIGYRQGMHELLAPLYYAVRYDVVNNDDIQDAKYTNLAEICSAEFTAADSWALFGLLMNGVHKWYEWRESLSTPSFMNYVIIPEGQDGMKPYTAPIVQACDHIQSNLLRACDPILYQSLQNAGIEPQIYGIRWLRLLFTREFSMPDALILWDGLFACDPSLHLVQWVCVAMLIRIRNELIPADYSGQLTALLRYPSPPPSSRRIDGAPHHTSLLIRQALALQIAPSHETGATIILENRTLLDIPVEVPSAPIPISPRRHQTTNSNNRTSPSAHLNGSPGRHLKSSSATLSDITRGLVERGESLGINKTLMNAVSEIRRNIPELAASLGVKANQTPSAFQLVSERPVEERPPWEPRTRFEVEKDLAMLRSRDKTLGNTLAWIVDALLQDESTSQDVDRSKLKKREALESLSYVRDVLMANTMELDSELLVGLEEKARRELKAQKEREELQEAKAAVTLNPPTPASLIDSHPRFSRPGSFSVGGSPTNNPPFHVPASKAQTDLASGYYTPTNFSSPVIQKPPPTSTRPTRGSRATQTTPQNEGYLDPLGALK